MSFIERHLITPCQIINRLEEDEPDSHGNPTYVDDNPIPTLCFITPRVGNEVQDGRAVEESWTLYLGPQMAGRINSFSYLDVEGYGRLECDGAPLVHRSLVGLHEPHHVEVSVRRSTA